jgi:hypothetical protein
LKELKEIKEFNPISQIIEREGGDTVLKIRFF